MGNTVFLLVHNKTNIKNATSSSLVASVFLSTLIFKSNAVAEVFTFSLVSNKHITNILLKAIHSRFYPRNILHTT